MKQTRREFIKSNAIAATAAAAGITIPGVQAVAAEGDAKIRWELIKDLFWDVSAWGTFDNEADSGNEFDYGIATGIGWEY